MTLTRRTILTAGASALLSPVLPRRSFADAGGLIPEAELRMIETRSGGRMGFAVLDTQDGRSSSWNSGDRFALSSTFKFLLAGAVLMRADAGQERLDREIPVPAAGKLVAWSPATEHRAGSPMSVRALCEAAVTLSDNTAANLLLETMGGPQGFTLLLREAGDSVTRLDRIEPELNEAAPGDTRDTTTPAAMLRTMKALLLGDVLQPASRRLLAEMMRGNTTGGSRLQAGLPQGWQIGDKTGTGGNGAVSDIAILYPPGRAPVLVAAYFQGSQRARADLDQLHAELGRLTAAYVLI
jgi:beta-lactamase class A